MPAHAKDPQPGPDPLADLAARLDAIEDFLAALPPGLATYGFGDYQGPQRIQAEQTFATKHNAIKGRADDRQRQRDNDKPDPKPHPGPNDPQ